MIARLLEGTGIASTLTAMVSLVSKLYPDEMSFAQSARFLGAFSGMTIGVMIGGFLFEALGYFGVFLTFSVAILLTSLLMFVFEDDASRDIHNQSRELTLWSLLKIKRVVLIVLCSLITDLLHYSLESTLALKLQESFNYSPSTIGLFFGIFLAGTAVVGVIGLFFPEKWEKRKIVIIMHWVNVVAPLLVGPSRALHFPNKPSLIGVGLFIGGSTRSLFPAYVIVEGLEGASVKYPDERERIGDLISSLYQTGEGVSFLCFPVLGSALYEVVGFESAMDVEAAVFIVNALIFTLLTSLDLRSEKRLPSIMSQGERDDEVPLMVKS